MMAMIAAVLLALSAHAEERQVTFQPRGPAEVGWNWVETARWTTSGHTTAKLGPIKVRDQEVDNRTSYACRVALREVEGGAPSAVAVRCVDATSVEDGEATELPVTGIEVLGLGLGTERKFRQADGHKLKRDQRSFFESNFRDPDPEQPDPLLLLLPPGPVAPGDQWSIDLDAIQGWFGADRFVMDTDRSHARVTLTEVITRGEARFGRLAFDTLIIPRSIKDGEFEEARMTLRGSALLPLDGRGPYQELELELALRYLGTIKAKGVKVQLDLRTLTSGFERKGEG